MIFVIGGRGRLGQAINASYKEDNPISVDRAIYQSWWAKGTQDDVSRFFEPWANSGGTVFVTAGILDPRISQEDHLRVNYLLPKHIIEGATKLGINVVTFGTVMESLLANKNPYIQSKAALGRHVSDISAFNPRVAHLRVHTLYGLGRPSSFMFLGQVFHALMNQTVFEMTQGKQLREYHHIDDEVQAIRTLVKLGANGVIDLNHGKPVTLNELASFIFNAFNAKKLLRIGALPEPKEENYSTVFDCPDLLRAITFREALPAVVNYLTERFLAVQDFL